MIVIAGHIRIDTANREATSAAASEMMKETHSEAGNISYTFSSDLSDPGLFYIFEEWKDQDALDFHFKTPHMAKFQGALGGLGIQEMKVQKYQVSSVGPIA
ncbi:MAG: antibiotic biosynthesis monooxygenase [Deltaproteobacteria bacterium]|nr:MAG: antibiotic biosynthesis monooxygenase [Deltaproteobacteria bacterium]TDJ20731.1 MAG: antibiotic biosynthesis monooxygenase [Deltaproteobacteria bacterium]